jgi:hypothetical protein
MTGVGKSGFFSGSVSHLHSQSICILNPPHPPIPRPPPPQVLQKRPPQFFLPPALPHHDRPLPGKDSTGLDNVSYCAAITNTLGSPFSIFSFPTTPLVTDELYGGGYSTNRVRVYSGWEGTRPNAIYYSQLLSPLNSPPPSHESRPKRRENSPVAGSAPKTLLTGTEASFSFV